MGLIGIAAPAARKTFRVRVQSNGDGGFVAFCDSPTCMSRGQSEDEALQKLRAEIRYREEYCPCTGVGEDYVQLDVVRVSGKR
jgi:hypothetical protein